MELSITFVCIMGMSIVFIGLISIVLLCKIMSILCRNIDKDEKTPAPVQAQIPVQQERTVPIANKQAIIAGVCAAIAEELGTDVKNIRVLSFK